MHSTDNGQCQHFRSTNLVWPYTPDNTKPKMTKRPFPQQTTTWPASRTTPEASPKPSCIPFPLDWVRQETRFSGGSCTSNLREAPCMRFSLIQQRLLCCIDGKLRTMDPGLGRVTGNAFYIHMYISTNMLGFITMNYCCKLQPLHGTMGVSSPPLPSLPWLWGARQKQYRLRQRTIGKAYISFSLVALLWLLSVWHGTIAMKLLKASKRQPAQSNKLKQPRHPSLSPSSSPPA